MDANDKTVLVNDDRAGGQGAEMSELEQLYLQLGKTYYEGKFEDPIPELLPIFDKITRIRKQYQPKPACPVCAGCGMPVEEEAVFCGNCGYRLKS